MSAIREPARVDFPSGGLTVVAYRWDPDRAPRAVVQITHGMGEHALRYADLARALNADGMVVYAQDHRGHGANVGSQDELGQLGEQGWAELVNDIDRLRVRELQDHPGLPLVLLGHSMGSFAVQQYILDHSYDVDAAVLTGTTVLDLLEPALNLDEPIDLAVFNAAFQPARTDYDWLSRDEARVDMYVKDPRCGFGLDPAAGKAMFVAARQLADPSRLAAMRKDLPVYIAAGEMDPLHGQLALVHALADRYTSAGLTDVTVKVYPQARHEVFNETNRDEVVDELLTWLDHKLPAEPAAGSSAGLRSLADRDQMRTPRVTVVGAGSWGTAVASMAARNAPVLLWARRPELAEQIATAHENPDYLAGLPLHPQLKATSSLPMAAEQADVIIMAVPTHAFRQTLAELAPHIGPWVPVVSLAKGFEEGTGKRMTELIAEELPGHPAGVLSGPNLAKEVLGGLAAAAVIAMPDHSVAQRLQSLVRTTLFRVYTGTDVTGVEMGGALKNVVAIAAGMADGLGTGDNTRAMVISRGVAEMTRLGVAMGGHRATFAGLTGLGDTIATCISPLSRNRALGMELAQGKTAEEATRGCRMVAEGVRASRAACQLAGKFGVDTPIFHEMNAVVHEGKAPAEAFRGLLRLMPAKEDEAG